MTSQRAALSVGMLALLFGGCSSAPPPAQAVAADPAPAAAPASEPAAAPPRDSHTAAAIELVLAGEHRSAGNRTRDSYRHPVETLLFFGIKPDMTVIEVWPGPGGWYTEVLAPLLMDHGKLYAALLPPAPGNEYVTQSLRQFDAKLASRPELYGKVTVTRLGPGDFNIAPPGTADLVLSFRNLHNWMNLGYAEAVIAELHRALKPGGILGVVDHRADPARPVDPRASNGYVNEEFAIRLFEAAGFEVVERSDINANPRDTRDYEQGVWALPPTYRAGNRDRAKYEGIGESDRFTLKFRKRPVASGSLPN